MQYWMLWQCPMCMKITLTIDDYGRIVNLPAPQCTDHANPKKMHIVHVHIREAR